MFGYCANYSATMPDITVSINCDTYFAVNASVFNLTDKDEFIFAVKNYDHVDSPYAFLLRARKSDIDENGEIVFKIPSEDTKNIKPDAFYYFAVLLNAYARDFETAYKKLTDNGKVFVDYGAQDLTVPTDERDQILNEILRVRTEAVVEEKEI
jgi:hypothetical protein